MIKKPNAGAKRSAPQIKNDLYRKFKNYFIGITDKEFTEYGAYSVAAYISANPLVEERVFDVLGNSIDEILPITGATGVGKTYLMLYCLKTYYGVNEIKPNTPELLFKDGGYDLVYYSDFNITEPSILKDTPKLILSKIKAMYEEILKYDWAEEVRDVKEYIQNYKLEVKFYAPDNREFQEALYKLTALLAADDSPIRNVVLVFDDLESLSETEQYSLMANFLALYENLKSKSKGIFCSKFFFCLRNNTFYNIYKQDFFNTHRASKKAYIEIVPSLSQIFDRRFDLILKSLAEKEAEQVEETKTENKKTKKSRKPKLRDKNKWIDARNILLAISYRVDTSYSDLLVKLNNNNISKALDDFLSILSNRRWTQRNVNPSASFTIHEGDYCINDTNILRILSMDEYDVYFQNADNPIRCILPKPGESKFDDVLDFFVLRAFRYKSECAGGDSSMRSHLIDTNDICSVIANCFIPSDFDSAKRNDKKHHIDRRVDSTIRYYADNRFIRKNTDPTAPHDSSMYYLLPRGEKIFDLFFSRSILFDIFRDAFFWDNSEFDIRCSKEIPYEELFLEALKYCEQLLKIEHQYFDQLLKNKALNEYQTMWGRWSITEAFVSGIEKSFQQFYREEDTNRQIISEKIEKLKPQITQLTSAFDAKFEEFSLFV